MNLELARSLKEEECVEIDYLYHLATPKSSKFNITVLSSLEANGYISPWNIDKLEDLLHTVHRLDLLPIITRYRDSQEYKTVVKERKKKSKGKKGGAKTTSAADHESQVVRLKDKKKIVKPLHTLLISHITELTQILDILREVVEEDRAMEQFHAVARDGEEFVENLHKMLRSTGYDSKRASSSSDDSTVVTPAAGKYKIQPIAS